MGASDLYTRSDSFCADDQVGVGSDQEVGGRCGMEEMSLEWRTEV